LNLKELLNINCLMKNISRRYISSLSSKFNLRRIYYEKKYERNFENLGRRVYDTLDSSDLDYINSELGKICEPTIFSGVGGSGVVSEFGAKVLGEKII